MIEITQNALRHGQVILAGDGRQYRIDWGYDNRLYLVREIDNQVVDSASGQNELRAKIARMEREEA